MQSKKSLFQSTLSARRATLKDFSCISDDTHFNPRSPRGERLRVLSHIIKPTIISIHALREESDRLKVLVAGQSHTFQSTLSARRATIAFLVPIIFSVKFQSTLSARRATSEICSSIITTFISIHALREESDKGHNHLNYVLKKFQSTLSARRATIFLSFPVPLSRISIHALREESDYYKNALSLSCRDFNPRSPRGERH